MTKFDFKIVVKPNAGAETLEELMTEEQVDALYTAGLDDSLIGASCGECYIDVTRDASSLSEAVSTAIAQVEGCGWEITRIEMYDAQEERTT